MGSSAQNSSGVPLVQAPGQVGEGLGSFGAEPGQVQQGSGEGSGEGLGGGSEEGCGEDSGRLCGAEPGQVQ